MITKFEEQIYNKHLAISRSVKGEAYTLRKDFSKLDDEKIIHLQKLSKLFTNYPHVSQHDYFMAPHKIFPTPARYDLEFYSSPKALKCYTQYMRLIDTQDADNPDTLVRLQQSLKFIFEFCRENGLTLAEYESYSPETVPSYIDHLKTHKINFYALHALTFQTPKIESRILEIMFGDFYGTFKKTRNKFYASKIMKEFAKQAKEQIENKLNE